METIKLSIQDGTKLEVKAHILMIELEGETMKFAAHRNVSKFYDCKRDWSVTHVETGLSLFHGQPSLRDAKIYARQKLEFYGLENTRAAIARGLGSASP